MRSAINTGQLSELQKVYNEWRPSMRRYQIEVALVRGCKLARTSTTLSRFRLSWVFD